MHKAHIGEDEWGHSDYQLRRDEVKQRRIERRNKKNTKRRQKREAHDQP